jgi:type I restriction enzyme S subunit
VSNPLPLSAVAAVRRSRVLPKSRPDLRFIGLGEVESQTMRVVGFLDATTMRSSAILFEPDDVLYGRLRPYLNKVFVARERGLASAEFIPLTPAHGVSGKWLGFRLNAPDFVFFASHLKDGDRPRVDWNQIGSFPLRLPVLPEQQRVVSAIETHFSRLDAAVASLTRAKAKVKRARASVLKAAVEGRLVPTEAALARAEARNYESASVLLGQILEERKKFFAVGRKTIKYKEPVAPDTSNLPRLRDGWCWATVDQIAHDVRYGTSAKCSVDAGGIPVLRMGNIAEGRLQLMNLKYLPLNHPDFPEQLLENGTLLFNRTNSAELVGKSAVYKGSPKPCACASYIIRVTLPSAGLADFLCICINSTRGRQWVKQVASQQVGQANVNGTKLRRFAIPLPPETEQHRIVAEVDRRLSVLDTIEVSLNTNLARCARLRQAILKRAFEGRLVPPSTPVAL